MADAYETELRRLRDGDGLSMSSPAFRTVAMHVPIRTVTDLHPPDINDVILDLDSGVLVALLEMYVAMRSMLLSTDRVAGHNDLLSVVSDAADMVTLELRFRQNHAPELHDATVTQLPVA